MAVVGCGGDAGLSGPAHSARSTMPVRLQWNANSGYCGEVAFIAAGMSLGQYTSQWTARQVAAGDPNANQAEESNHLLLTWPPQGSTWQRAARAMRLEAEGFDPDAYEKGSGRHADAFLSWIKNRFLAGSRVIIGVFNNTGLLEEPGPGQPEYDHIVPVMGIGSRQPLRVDDDPGNPSDYQQAYYGTDRITIGDNGLFGPFGSGPNWGAGNTSNNPTGSTLYTATFDGVQKSRAQANAEGAACPFASGGDITNACAPWVYSIYDDATNLGNYGVAISGVVDDTPGGPVAAPVSVTTSVNNEGRQNQPTMASPPPGQPMSLTATVTIPDQSQAWNVYLYTSFANVPTGSFNTAARTSPSAVARTWRVPVGSGPSWTTTLPRARTNGTYVFRAVPADAP